MTKNLPVGSLSLDLDNKWSYMKTHGDPGWQDWPSYLPLVVPRVLDLLRDEELRITFFVVGQDAALAKNEDALRAIAAAGHEIGNHSLNHEPWLHLYTAPEMQRELARAEEEIARATGIHPSGFRGPGYSFSDVLLRQLAQRGYLYDASTFPTFLGPLARAYYFMTSQLGRTELEQRKRLFGTLKEGFRPLRPYFWRLPGQAELLEIPVTTSPIFRTPFHFSYLLYLRKLGSIPPLLYFRLAMLLCRLRGVAPSLLLHPLDFLGCEDDKDMAFFPAMDLPSTIKLDLVRRVLRVAKASYELVPLRVQAAQLKSAAPELRRVDLVLPKAELYTPHEDSTSVTHTP